MDKILFLFLNNKLYSTGILIQYGMNFSLIDVEYVLIRFYTIIKVEVDFDDQTMFH